MRTIFKIPTYISLTAVIMTASAIDADNENMAGYQHNAASQPSASPVTSESEDLAHKYDGVSVKTIDQASDKQAEKLKSTMLVNNKKTDTSGNLPRGQKAGDIPLEDDDC